uniref:Uncharacterized protein n=1 Tax=Picea glauca TaxID=3330 RepID=A0A101LVX3_PICGL|nr:hypothetical protein ABT39_MTgene1944 [Picea glauca]
MSTRRKYEISKYLLIGHSRRGKAEIGKVRLRRTICLPASH